MKAFYEWLAHVSFKYLGSMFMEPNGTKGKYVMSLGRVALAALLMQAMWHWYHVDRDIVPGMKETLFALMAYCFGTKVTETVRAMRTGDVTTPAPVPPAEGPTGAT